MSQVRAFNPGIQEEIESAGDNLVKGIVLKQAPCSKRARRCAGKVTCVGEKVTERCIMLVSAQNEF